MSDQSLSPLLNAIEAHENASTRSGDLAKERTAAFNAYLGKPYGNEVEGRSQVVSHDVADTIEWIKPSLMRIFASGDDIVSFDPKGEEDVESAQQETDYTNFVLTQKNSWFRTSYVWFTDALMQKNAYVKAWWDKKKDVTTEKYQGLTSDQVALVAQDPEVTIVKQEFYDDPYTPGMQLFDIECKRTSEYGCVKYKEIPPERVIVSQWAQSIDLEDVDFFEHFEWQTVSDMKANGLEVPKELGDEAGAPETGEEDARNLYGEPWQDDTETNDKSTKRYKVRECWIKFDDNNDGIAELLHVIVVGKKELLKEEAEFIPAAALTPKMMPHRHIGRSIADEIADLQLIKTTLLRGTLDNMYLLNNGRYGVDEKKVNLDDMLTSRPGGLVRTDGSPLDKIMPFAHPNMMQSGLEAIEYVDQIKQNRTGVTAYVTSVDSNVLNETASGTQMLQNAAMAKIELIARVFAETGVKRLMWLIHALSLQNATKAEKVRLRNKWVEVDPRQWKKRMDMSVSVGLGTGNREQQKMDLQGILALMKELIPLGLVSKNNVRHATTKYIQAAGFKDHESFLAPMQGQQTSPEDQPIQLSGPPDPMQAEKLKQDAENQRTMVKLQGEQQNTAAQLQSDQQKTAAQLQHEAQLEMVRQQEETKRKEMEIASRERIAMAQIQASRETEHAKIQHDAAKTSFQAEHAKKEGDPVEGFSKAALDVVERAKATKGDESMQVLMKGLQEVVKAASAPKEIIRGTDGKALGIRPAQ